MHRFVISTPACTSSPTVQVRIRNGKLELRGLIRITPWLEKSPLKPFCSSDGHGSFWVFFSVFFFFFLFSSIFFLSTSLLWDLTSTC